MMMNRIIVRIILKMDYAEKLANSQRRRSGDKNNAGRCSDAGHKLS